jgi:hypothetical protein
MTDYGMNVTVTLICSEVLFDSDFIMFILPSNYAVVSLTHSFSTLRAFVCVCVCIYIYIYIYHIILSYTSYCNVFIFVIMHY